MGSARDSTPDPKHASGSTRSPWPPRVRPRPMSGIAPATPPRPPAGALTKAATQLSPLIPVPSHVRPLSQQPKLLDRLHEALRARHYSPRTEETYRHWVKRFSSPVIRLDTRSPLVVATPASRVSRGFSPQFGRPVAGPSPPVPTSSQGRFPNSYPVFLLKSTTRNEMEVES
jgi:hypothetical protein